MMMTHLFQRDSPFHILFLLILAHMVYNEQICLMTIRIVRKQKYMRDFNTSAHILIVNVKQNHQKSNCSV